MSNFPFKDKELKLGMIGMTEGNGHPYSWTAMFNDYDSAKMKACPFPAIPDYLEKQPKDTIGIKGMRISHIYCNDRADAESVQAATFIDKVVDRPEDMIGEIDAVIVATDVGSEHVERCRPFVEAGIPMFVDKPLVLSEDDLKTFTKWREDGAKFLSSSSMRYVKEMEPYHGSTFELGKLRYIGTTMAKKWETYGIHALEFIYPVLGPGFLSIQNTGTYEQTMVHIKHSCGADVSIKMGIDMFGGGGTLLVGTANHAYVQSKDSYYSFKKQLDVFAQYLRDGIEPYPFSETQELMKLVIGGLRSRNEGGRIVMLDEIKVK